jgi:hypothetical protein
MKQRCVRACVTLFTQKLHLHDDIQNTTNLLAGLHRARRARPIGRLP